MTNQQKEIEDKVKKAHDWLYEAVIARKSLSWVKVGKLIGKSDNGAKLVFKNYSLGLDVIEEASKELELHNEFLEVIKKAPVKDADVSLKDAIRQVIDNTDEALSFQEFRLFVDNLKKDALIEYLEKRERA